jgi:hypothetical protein
MFHVERAVRGPTGLPDTRRVSGTATARKEVITMLAADMLRHVSADTSTPAGSKMVAMILREAKRDGSYADAVAYVMDLRQAEKRTLLLRQAGWRTRISRRPQRNRHHDSAAIRETYCRIHFHAAEGQSWAAHLPWTRPIWQAYHGETRQARSAA